MKKIFKTSLFKMMALSNSNVTVYNIKGLENAIATFNSSRTNCEIKILGEIEIDSTLVITNNTKTLTLSGSGTLKRAERFNGNLIKVNSSSTLIIDGINLDGNKVMGTGSLVEIDLDSKFTLKSGTLCNNMTLGNGGGVNNAGIFTMIGGTIRDNSSTHLGGGVNSSGTFTMTGGNIRDNMSKTGGGVYSQWTFTMYGGIISGNTAISVAGAYINSVTSVVALGGGAVISGNTDITTNSSNLLLVTDKYITLGTGENAPIPSMRIVINNTTTMNGTIVSTGATDEIASYFFTDDYTKYVKCIDGELRIMDK